MSRKICPLMSGTPVVIEAEIPADGLIHNGEVYCEQENCRLWIEVFTTELIRTSGCSFELMPQMVNGQLRV
ncbi:hypothetical protein [Thiolapillus sp.]